MWTSSSVVWAMNNIPFVTWRGFDVCRYFQGRKLTGHAYEKPWALHCSSVVRISPGAILLMGAPGLWTGCSWSAQWLAFLKRINIFDCEWHRISSKQLRNASKTFFVPQEMFYFVQAAGGPIMHLDSLWFIRCHYVSCAAGARSRGICIVTCAQSTTILFVLMSMCNTMITNKNYRNIRFFTDSGMYS